MWLCVDVGNTSVKVAPSVEGGIGWVRRAGSRSVRTPDDVDKLLEAMLEDEDVPPEDVEGLVLASVVPSWTRDLQVVAERRRIAVLAVDADTIPMPVRVAHPEAVGPDRLVNAYAAVRLHRAPAIVVDAGTATTFDVVDQHGAYVGGAIAAGAELGLQALGVGTARLPRVALEPPASAIGIDTADALRSGAVYGHLGLVRELLARISSELSAAANSAPCRILTGGFSASPWLASMPEWDVVDPDLTLKGLALVHAERTAGLLA
jgi:type III pantothenate kinase